MSRLVCLHGFTGRPAAWDAVLDALPTDVEALSLPLTGHAPEVPRTADFDAEVDRLARGLPASPCHLVGYSLGGRLALGLLVRHRERFTSATLIGVHPGLAGESERRRRVAADEELARSLEAEGIERFVERWEGLSLFETQRLLLSAVRRAQRASRLAHDAAGLAHALRALSLGRMPSFRSRLGDLDMPIRLMAGSEDGKFRRLAERMAAALPRAELEIVPRAGHNLLLEAPRAVASAILGGMRDEVPA